MLTRVEHTAEEQRITAMKKLFSALLCLCLLVLCACGRAMPKELAPYRSILRKHYVSSKLWSILYDGVKHYAFYDLDGDGTEELLLGAEQGPLTLIGILDVYTIKDKKAVFQDVTVWDRRNPPPELFENGTIKTFDNENDRFSYYRFEAGELKFKTRLFDNVEYQAWLELGGWEIDDEFLYSLQFPFDPDKEDIPLTKEEFEQLQKDMEGDGQTVELDWKPLSEYRG